MQWNQLPGVLLWQPRLTRTELIPQVSATVPLDSSLVLRGIIIWLSLRPVLTGLT